MNEVNQFEYIDRRVPVLDSENGVDFEAMRRQWLLITEAVRREILVNYQYRQIIVPFCQTPVSETLPLEFYDAVSHSGTFAAKVCQRYAQSLGTFLNIPTVPDEALTPDITYSPNLPPPPEEMYASQMRYLMEGDPDPADTLHRYGEADFFTLGTTPAERKLVAERYVMARDVKMLSLGAEMTDVLELNAQSPSSNELVLPSGIHIVIDQDLMASHADLLQPHIWEKRRQVKDRVYEITVGGKPYILKEKKTARHTDTKKGGHQEGNTSAMEFEIAKLFYKTGVVQTNELSVTWEQPIGYVEFPDGFQFTVFSFEQELIPDAWAHRSLVTELLEHEDKYLAEYQAALALVPAYLDHPLVKKYQRPERRSRMTQIGGLLSQRFKPTQPPPLLTVVEYLQVKAFLMIQNVDEMRTQQIKQFGFTNSDLDGYAYQVKSIEEGAHLVTTGFDFEYYRRMTPQEEAATDELRKLELSYAKDHCYGMSFEHWNYGSAVTSSQRAVYLALMDEAGKLDGVDSMKV